MKNTTLLITIIFGACFNIYGQSRNLTISNNINLPKDSIESRILINSLDSFLAKAEENIENKWIFKNEPIETQILIDEIHNGKKSGFYENDSFYKAYLTNVVELNDGQYAIQLAYIGIHEKSSILRSSFELIAHKIGEQYHFSSPLKRNTQNWQVKKLNQHVYHYPYDLDFEIVQHKYDLAKFFDEKLKIPEKETHYYFCKEETDPKKLFGVNYKSDYNGRNINSSWESSTDDKSLYVMPDSRFYNHSDHDLWHFRLSQVIPRKEVHRRVDCHIAYLYGGSWGISWDELFLLFKDKFVKEKVDWLEHKKNKSNFETNGRKNYTDDFIGALLVKEIEEQKGFGGVWRLLKTKRSEEETEYFDVLEELTGISKKNYNKKVHKLIQQEIERHKGKACQTNESHRYFFVDNKLNTEFRQFHIVA